MRLGRPAPGLARIGRVFRVSGVGFAVRRSSRGSVRVGLRLGPVLRVSGAGLRPGRFLCGSGSGIGLTVRTHSVLQS
ncbi:hypothetical protein [Streptomyces erythrochromogenes]|uniref:hypothetical protein n=1 Tax=Streptomyces erythrochromogenes TaxID=285574 RepID=UPI0038097708